MKFPRSKPGIRRAVDEVKQLLPCVLGDVLRLLRDLPIHAVVPQVVVVPSFHQARCIGGACISTRPKGNVQILVGVTLQVAVGAPEVVPTNNQRVLPPVTCVTLIVGSVVTVGHRVLLPGDTPSWHPCTGVIFPPARGNKRSDRVGCAIWHGKVPLAHSA